MSEALFLARVVLAVTFLVAAVAKLTNGAATRQALRDFGVPAGVARPAALMLVASEFAVAAALLVPTTSRGGGIGALMLLAPFTAAIVHKLRVGRRVPCGCFGQLRATPISWRTLVRNALFGMLAMGVALGGPGSLPLLPGTTPAETGVLAALVALSAGLLGLGWITLQLWMQQGVLLRRIETLEAGSRAIAAGTTEVSRLVDPPGKPRFGLGVGAAAPDAEVATLDGERLRLHELWRDGTATLLTFVSPDCQPCQRVLADIAQWQQSLEGARVLVLSTGDVGKNREMARTHDLRDVLLQTGHEVQQAYGVPGTPAGVLVDGTGRIASAVAAGPQAVRSLVPNVTAATVPAE
jgi:peroxiredoxin